MSATLAVAGSPDDLLLAGADPARPGAGSATVVLGDAAPPDGGRVLRWANPGDGSEDELRIAPEGRELWRRAPWPAADTLFELPEAPDPGVLVAGGEPDRRAEISEMVSGRGLRVEEQPRLTRAGLEAVDSVVLLPSEPGTGESVPIESMAVLAARRLLVTPSARVAFGLMPGIDHLQFDLAIKAADRVESAALHPGAYTAMRTWGAYAAGRHRASLVYRNLETDLALAGLLTP